MNFKTPSYIALFYLVLSMACMNSSFADSGQLHEDTAKTSKEFMQQLGRAMKSEMKSNGPVAAIKVCTEMSPSIASDISRKNGWKVTRVGTRVRNPMLAVPDIWEQKVLAQFQARSERGESLKNMSHSELVDEPNGKYFRFMQAVGVKPVCLTCHGSPSDIPGAVKTILSERYPHDKATDYKPGDLRGAVSIKRPISSM